MNNEETLLQGIAADPSDDAAWLILADCLEEAGEGERAELVRLRESLRQLALGEERRAKEARMQEMLLAGVRPSVPHLTLGYPKMPDLTLALIPPGTFLMGSPEDELDRWSDEGPRHPVTITRGFWLGIHHVAQMQWRAVMGDNPSHFKGLKLPVERVSWTECQEFCAKLGKRTGRTVRLATEAEWEYACRAGTTSPFHFGPTLSSDYANYDANIVYGPQGKKGAYRQKPVEPGSFPPNAFGLYDMHGNIREWCHDVKRPYDGEHVTDPGKKGGKPGSARTVRGGSWYNVPWFCRSACRLSEGPGRQDKMIGCRILVELA